MSNNETQVFYSTDPNCVGSKEILQLKPKFQNSETVNFYKISDFYYEDLPSYITGTPTLVRVSESKAYQGQDAIDALNQISKTITKNAGPHGLQRAQVVDKSLKGSEQPTPSEPINDFYEDEPNLSQNEIDKLIESRTQIAQNKQN